MGDQCKVTLSIKQGNVPYLLETLFGLLTRSLHRELGAEDVAELSTITVTST